ncbi:MAG: VTT domain-containing protein [Anaerovoracaceae bacterium]
MKKLNKEQREAKKQEFKGNMHETKMEVKSNLKAESRKKVVISMLKLSLLLIIVIGIPLYIYFFQRDLIMQFKSFDDILAFLNKYKTESILVYIGLQILQIIISIIPGQAFQFAAGYLYGFLPGILFSIIGALLGTTMSFYLAKFLGKDAMHLMFGEEKMTYFINRLNSKKSYVIVFLIYLIPGLPKDLVSYAAGVSEIKIKPFLFLSLIGRIPGMSGSLLIGHFYNTGTYGGILIVGTITFLSILLCIFFKKPLSRYIDNLYAKIK